jgi:hypothetical protein
VTNADVIKSSLRVCKVLAKGEAPSADEMQDSVEALQMMLDAWGADNLMIWGQVTEHFPLVMNQQVYTIGVGGNFNTVYPYKITDAYVRDDNSVDTGIDILTRTEYDAYNDKAISTTRPQALFYDQGQASQVTPSGTIYIYPIPDGSSPYTLYIVTLKPLVSLLTSTANFTLLPPYKEAVKYNLAIRLWDEFHDKEPVPQHILRMAKDAKHVIERMSFEFDIMAMSVPGIKTGIWNILSDTENG